MPRRNFNSRSLLNGSLHGSPLFFPQEEVAWFGSPWGAGARLNPAPCRWCPELWAGSGPGAGPWKESWECCADAILAVSVNRAKGLDRRAVVVTGLPAWEEASRDEYQAKTFVQGVTRARQLLAVVTRGG